jgi:hypothetical protein
MLASNPAVEIRRNEATLPPGIAGNRSIAGARRGAISVQDAWGVGGIRVAIAVRRRRRPAPGAEPEAACLHLHSVTAAKRRSQNGPRIVSFTPTVVAPGCEVTLRFADPDFFSSIRNAPYKTYACVG